MARDIYAEVTNALVASIEADPGKPVMPWNRTGTNEMPNNIASGDDYHGVNIINLWVTSQAAGFATSVWGTFRQWRAMGASVQKGQKSTPVVFYKQVIQEYTDSEDASYRVLKYFSVFNADQVDGYDAPVLADATEPVARIAAIDVMIERAGANIREVGAQAYYNPSTDQITMPDSKRFFNTPSGTRSENFYAVLLHELTHWTAHPSRCDRDLHSRFGDTAYAMEELVAEIGSAFFCARLGISSTPREDHAQYLGNWLSVLKNDKKAIFSAAAKAQAAIDFVL
jgi:antirestriction protein ArdC